jgi:glycosyltransferase involved in cell wall biosynthesis
LAANLANAARSRTRIPTPRPLDLTPQRLATAPAVTVVVPTRNERDNVAPLVEQLADAFQDVSWELLFVDDSSDDTTDRIQDLAGRHPGVRLHRRSVETRHTGLGGAVAAGFGLARGDVVVVMDGDLQHPPTLAPVLAGIVGRGAADLAIASRYSPGGSRGTGLAGPSRVAASQLSRFAARAALRRARGVRDPLGGFFAVRRSLVEGPPLQPRGFKVLLEVLVRTPWATVVEVPYRFEPRRAGTSKAGLREGARFGRHLVSLVRAERSGG